MDFASGMWVCRESCSNLMLLCGFFLLLLIRPKTGALSNLSCCNLSLSLSDAQGLRRTIIAFLYSDEKAPEN